MDVRKISEQINSLSNKELAELTIDLETQKLIMGHRLVQNQNALMAKRLKYWWLPTSDYMAPALVIVVFLLLLFP
ncbi:hypothetical protein P2G88_12405 [Aliiglaciecola sp. CAU 1673]|uniref:hypothetical protein n=1 Tax=Aliiglaciecola sp. CAU 1673 TaxID=3032595 RepID=UPI0023DC1A37|nr:hypothetical protein [Aliiglaciecola sp. CAU 1673]MDF2179053.1 hypothetical protein [Aliiglaciecola sp. CAU 1673]